MKTSRIPELDLLRFLAALAVVFFHYAYRGYAADDLTVMNYPELHPFSIYGFMGVHLFFMISGFVIMMTADGAGIKKFVASRISRLAPAFWVCCTITFAVTYLIGGDQFEATWRQYGINMATLGIGKNASPIDGAYWSLDVELRFYRLVLILIVIGQIGRMERWLFLWLGSVVLINVLSTSKFSEFLVAEYAGFFIAGAGFFLIRAHGFSKSRVVLVCASWLLCVYHEIILLNDFNEYYGVELSPVIVVLAMTSFFIVLLMLALRKTPCLRGSIWVWLGAVSYPLYLIHQNVGYMIFNAVGEKVDRDTIFWGVVVAAIMFSLLIHAAIEKPFSKPLKRGIEKGIDKMKSYATIILTRV